MYFAPDLVHLTCVWRNESLVWRIAHASYTAIFKRIISGLLIALLIFFNSLYVKLHSYIVIPLISWTDITYKLFYILRALRFTKDSVQVKGKWYILLHRDSRLITMVVFCFVIICNIMCNFTIIKLFALCIELNLYLQ